MRNFSLEEAVVREVERRKRCISAEEERCLVAQRLPVVLSFRSLSELPSSVCKIEWFSSRLSGQSGLS